MQKKIKNKLLVGLTGGIASGKTTVARLFDLLGVHIYNSDLRAKQLILNDDDLKQSIISSFGEKSYREDGSYNTEYISKIVFSDKSRLEELNSIVHPAVFQDQKKWFSAIEDDYAIIETALLFETKKQSEFDKIIVVAADDNLRVQRIMQRDGLTEERALRRINNQMPQQLKIEQSDIVVWNNGKESLIEQVVQINRKLRS